LVPAAYLIPLNKAASAASTEAAAEAAAETAVGHDHVISRDNNKTNNNETNNDNNDADDVTHQSAERKNNKDNNKDNNIVDERGVCGKTHPDVAASLPIIDGKYKTEESPAKNELPSAGQPHSPSKVFVQRVLSDFSILLGWVMPPMDEFGYSNGVQVKGYRIFVNDELVEVVPSALQTKILVDSSSFPKHPYKDFGSDYICFKVVATSVGGVDSPPSTCILEVGLGAMKSETGSDVIGGVKSGEPIAALTPGEQPLTESEQTASELETGSARSRQTFKTSPKDNGMTSTLTSSLTDMSSLTAMTSSLTEMTTSLTAMEGKRRRKPSRPPSPKLNNKNNNSQNENNNGHKNNSPVESIV